MSRPIHPASVRGAAPTLGEFAALLGLPMNASNDEVVSAAHASIAAQKGGDLRSKVTARLGLPVDASNAQIFAAFDSQLASANRAAAEDAAYKRVFG